MHGLLLIQIFSIAVFFKFINAKNKGLTPHLGKLTDGRSASTLLPWTLDDPAKLVKLQHKNRSPPEPHPPATGALAGREGVYYYPAKVNGARSRDPLTPLRLLEARMGNSERQKVTEGWSPSDLRGLLSFYEDKSKLNRSPAFHSLLAKTMHSGSSIYPPDNHELQLQLSDAHRAARRGEGVPSSGLDPEENRPSKSTRHRASDTLINGINSPSETSRRIMSLLYHFNILREDHNKQLCSVECRKEKNEREFYCNSDFAINGIVHDIATLDKGLQMVTLLVDSDGFYRMGRLYVTPDGFFFKVHILVIDTFNCRRLCPDLKFGGRYIMMGLIYHRRYPLPMWVQERASGRLKPGDGLVKSSSYVRRFNKKRDHKVQLLRDGHCGSSFLGSQQK
ncbi:UPF0450 protein C17orf58 homolog isoform X3 [Leucoraja erinacea]|uniref:UPF0450 protein C17orf58 homolog isoform X3 n=1 Tax=Leucoraja erinaceus TaxID=7782 RepID=UPI002458FF85|nr:UPF0450 protein C17orf58 homolog isoform X3 [Leucoraja erinacea]